MYPTIHADSLAPRTLDQMIADEAAARAKWEAETTYEGFTIARLREMFNRISDPSAWKGELAGIVALPEIDEARAAAVFFAGSTLTVVYTEPEGFGPGRNCFVKGPGYYASVGA
jgi:hypothetical protein